jgi:hypothetical protein
LDQACTELVHGGSSGEVVHQDIGEVEGVAVLHDAVTGQREYAGGPAASSVVVPEAGPNAVWQARCGDGAPAPVGESAPGLLPGDLAEQPEHLGVTCRPVAPAEAVALDELRTVGRVGVGHQEAVGAGLVTTDDVVGSLDRELHQIGLSRGAPDGGQGVDDAEGPVGDVMRARRGGPHRPVHAVGGPGHGRQIRRDGVDGQLHVTHHEGAQPDAGVAGEELEHRAPAAALGTLTYSAPVLPGSPQHPVDGGTGKVFGRIGSTTALHVWTVSRCSSDQEGSERKTAARDFAPAFSGRNRP